MSLQVATQCISVAMTIAMDTTLADSRDHDPSFGISDGKSFVGIQIPDKRTYGYLPHAVDMKVMMLVVD